MPPYDEITEPAIAALVDSFYAKARRDPVIGPVFETAVADWDEHLDKLYDFWSSVMLTTGRYKGNPMAAHLKLPLEPAFFDPGWHYGGKPPASFSHQPPPHSFAPRLSVSPKASNSGCSIARLW